jgi:hypothetical protein
MVQKLNPAALKPILNATSNSVMPINKKKDRHLDLFRIEALRLKKSPRHKQIQADRIPAAANPNMIKADGTLVASDSVANEMANLVFVRHIIFVFISLLLLILQSF